MFLYCYSHVVSLSVLLLHSLKRFLIWSISLVAQVCTVDQPWCTESRWTWSTLFISESTTKGKYGKKLLFAMLLSLFVVNIFVNGWLTTPRWLLSHFWPFPPTRVSMNNLTSIERPSNFIFLKTSVSLYIKHIMESPLKLALQTCKYRILPACL